MSLNKALLSIGDRLPESIAERLRNDSRLAAVVRPVVNRFAPAYETLVTVTSGPAKGIRLAILPSREKFYWTGLHESHVQHAMAELLKPSHTFWDIGAHTGFFSLLGSRLVGPNGHVHAFEPMTLNRQRLERSIAANSADNIVVHGDAVAATSGVARLHAHSESVMWSLKERSDSPGGEEVRCRTLDDLAAMIGPPDLIKIDAEGAEMEVLKGGEALLRQSNPAIIVEFTGDEELTAARRLLASHRFENIGRNHWLLRRNDVSSEDG